MNRFQEKVNVNCYFYLLINKHKLNTIAAAKRGDFFLFIFVLSDKALDMHER